MKRLSPIQKVKGKIPIPPDLGESCQEVHQLIKQAKYDRDVSLGYAGAINVGNVKGGRYGKKDRPFILDYFPAEGRCYWRLPLHPTEIEDIADGVITEITLYSCTSMTCQCKFRDDGRFCSCCDYLEDDEQLIELSKLSFDDKREWARAYFKLKPDASAGHLIGDYNGIRELGERLGWFSTPELDAIKKEMQDKGELPSSV